MNSVTRMPTLVSLTLSTRTIWLLEDTRNPNKWAEDLQVKSWRAEKDGLIPITLEEPWVISVQNFLKNRAAFEIFKVAMFITDSEIRKSFMDDLENILSASGEKRINALNNLMNTMTGTPSARFQIYKALKILTNESGYKNNPFLMIALAATTSYKSNTPSIGSAEINQDER